MYIYTLLSLGEEETMRASPSAPATCTKGGVPPHELHDKQIYETHIHVSSKLLSPTAYDGVLQCVRRAEHRTEYAEWGDKTQTKRRLRAKHGRYSLRHAHILSIAPDIAHKHKYYTPRQDTWPLLPIPAPDPDI